MGTLIYGHDYGVGFDDRTLSHLQIAMGLKLRRREGFFLTWSDDSAGDQRRSSIWIDPAIPLVFLYEDASATPINREWLEQLTESSNSARGLHLIPEASEAR